MEPPLATIRSSSPGFALANARIAEYSFPAMCTVSTLRRLSAQLARTEEAAKRVITLRDPSAKGGVAGRLLDAERALAKASAEAVEAQATARTERQRASMLKQRVVELQAALEAAGKDQRLLARQLGAAEVWRPAQSSCIRWPALVRAELSPCTGCELPGLSVTLTWASGMS